MSLALLAVVALGTAIYVQYATRVPWPPPAAQSSTSVDQSRRLQAMLDSGAKVVDVGATGIIHASLTVPAGVTLRSSGAILVPSTGAGYAVRTGGKGARIVGVKVQTSDETKLVGGESAFRVQHSGTQVINSSVTGDGFLYGVLLASEGGTLDNVSISGNNFTSTSYGVLKHSVRTVSLRIEDNSFTDIRRGDAIELNAGGERGTIIRGNTITGAHRDDVSNAGLGIGIAGHGRYGSSADSMSGGCLIADNRIADVDVEAIHLENVADCRIERNSISAAAGTRTSFGIALYGVRNTVVRNNRIGAVDIGIFDALGVSASQYVRSATDNTYAANEVSDCSIGIKSMVAGDNTTLTANGNTIRNCRSGIFHSGATRVVINNNRVQESSTPYFVNLRPADTRRLGSATRSLTFIGNVAYQNEQAVPNAGLTVANVTGATVRTR